MVNYATEKRCGKRFSNILARKFEESFPVVNNIVDTS